MNRFILLLSIISAASAFLSSRILFHSSTAINGDVFFDGSCEDRLKDKTGKCPGQPGFIPQVLEVKEDYKDFKSFQAAQKAKKEAAEAAKKAAEGKASNKS